MLRKTTKVLAVVMFLICLTLIFTALRFNVCAQPSVLTGVKVYMNDQLGAVGERFAVKVQIQGVSEPSITGYDFSLNYDSSYMSPVSAMDGDFLKSNVTFSWEFNATAVHCWAETDDGGAIGDGTLADLIFSCEAVGKSNLGFNKVIVYSGPDIYTPETIGSKPTIRQVIMPVLEVYPQEITGLAIGDDFTVEVKVSNLNDTEVDGCVDWQWGCPPQKGGTTGYVLGDLEGIMIDFTWDPTILNYSSRTVTIPVEDYPDGVLHKPVFSVEDNMTAGYYRLSYANLGGEAFNGNGTVFNMTFTVLNHGAGFLRINRSQLIPSFQSGFGRDIPHFVRNGHFGRDVEVSKVEGQEKIAAGYPAWVDVTVGNLGGETQNFAVAAYYNTTGDGGWTPLRLQPLPELPLKPNEQNVTEMSGTGYRYGCQAGEVSGWVKVNLTLRLVWNTTGIPYGYYRVKVNATGVPNEEDLTNNVQYSENVIFITRPSHDMLIETLSLFTQTTNPTTGQHFEFQPPLVTGETMNVNCTVFNGGAQPEVGLNVTIYTIHPNDTREILLASKNITQGGGDRTSFETEWDTAGLKGTYAVGANVSRVVNETNTDNNQMYETFWVVEPPIVNFTYTKKFLLVNDTVTFNGTISNHTMLGGSIIHWNWEVYKGEARPENLKYTYNGGPIMNYTFGEWSANWAVILNVTDTPYGLFYMGLDRPSTRPYSCQQNMIMTERPTDEEDGWPPIWTYLIILVVIVIVALAVYLVKFRKTESE